MSKHDQIILDAVNLHGTISVIALAEQLKVSDQTIRRIVKPLVDSGKIKKVHGALVSNHEQSDPPLGARLLENRQAKVAIAEEVVDLLPDGSVLAIDAGATTTIIAQALTRRKNLLVVTNSAPVAATLAMVPGNRVFMAGTQLRNHDGAAYDKAAYDVVRGFSAEFVLLSASAVHPNYGFLVNDQHEVDMANEMMSISERVIMSVDHSKWGRSRMDSPLRLPRLQPSDYVVTDEKPGAAFDEMVRSVNLRLAQGAFSLAHR